jgi:hypothetical protein
MADDVKRLLLQIDASVELLKRNLQQGDAQIARFERDAQRRLANIDSSFANAGRGVSTLRGHFEGLRGALATVGVAFTAISLVSYARDALHYAAGLSETAQQIGVTVEQLQALRLAAEQNGASVESLERSMAILNRTLGQAQAGVPAAVQAFRAIGISRDQLMSFRNGGEALDAVMGGLARLRNVAQQTAAGQRLMGRGFSEVSVMMTQGVGSMSRWITEAREAGIITDEQARKADAAEDALGRLATAIRAQLAGAIADSLPGIQSLAQDLATLAEIAIRVISLLQQVGALIAAFTGGSGNAASVAGRILVEGQAIPNRLRAWGRGEGDNGVRRPPPGLDLDLSPQHSGGGRNGRNAEKEAERRNQHWNNEMRQLQMDALRSQLDYTTGLDDRAELQDQLADLERQQWLADVWFRKSQGELDGAQVEKLILARQQVDAERETARRTEQTSRAHELERRIAEEQVEAQQETLRLQGDLATTAHERRRIELELLQVTYRARREALQRIIDDSQDAEEVAAARRAQADLPGQQALEEQRIRQSTRSPLEEWRATIPRTADEINEALERVAANGMEALNNGLVDAITGARSLGDVFRSVTNGIIADLLRIAIQKMLLGPLENMLFGGGYSKSILGDLGGALGLPGRASGGPVDANTPYLVGERGPEIIIPKAPAVVVPNHMLSGGRQISVTVHVDAREAVLTETVKQWVRDGVALGINAAAPQIEARAVRSTFDTMSRLHLA